MMKLARVIDSVTRGITEAANVLCYVLVIAIVYDVTMRYVFSAPTMWAVDVAVMSAGTIYVIGWSYAQLDRSHLKVDVIYAYLSPRGKAILNVLGTLLVILPFTAMLTNVSWDWAWRAWVINEKKIETLWYPPVAPYRTVIALGFGLLFLQSLAHLIRDLYFLLKKEPHA
jgi:TRAP-type mannitol/chloroaromatic compound transport system permease small subunit